MWKKVKPIQTSAKITFMWSHIFRLSLKHLLWSSLINTPNLAANWHKFDKSFGEMGNPKLGTLANSEDPDKCCIPSGSTLFDKAKPLPCADPESFFQRESNFVYVFFVDTTISGPLSSPHHFFSLVGRWWPITECWLGSFVVLQGIQTSIAKRPYIFVIFQGSGPPIPLSGSAHDLQKKKYFLYLEIITCDTPIYINGQSQGNDTKPEGRIH